MEQNNNLPPSIQIPEIFRVKEVGEFCSKKKKCCKKYKKRAQCKKCPKK